MKVKTVGEKESKKDRKYLGDGGHDGPDIW